MKNFASVGLGFRVTGLYGCRAVIGDVSHDVM